MKNNERMIMTPQDEMEFKNATSCYICGDGFGDAKKDTKVRDHDHRTGQYRGAAHCKCNLDYFANRYVPVVFHNFRGYDGHFIVKEMRSLGAKCDNINPIAQNSEKFMSFTIDKLKFIDSMLFLNSSLESLSDNLVDDKHDDKYHKFTNMKSAFGEHIELMCRKGIYPYEWMDNVDKFN